ncbi:hypothetical protein JL894_12980 [Staphylococcus pseudintermedius]|nr:hypothetical protein [Staphylococcus pseudintermedius]
MEIKDLKIGDKVSVEVGSQQFKDTDDEKWVYETIFGTAEVTKVNETYEYANVIFENGFGATFEGSNSTEYLEFESYIDEDGEILDNLQDVMYHIASVCNWRESFGEER